MKQLKEYQQACDSLARYFAKRYFGNDTDSYWVADDIGGVYFINDYFFNMSKMADYIKYHYTKEKMFKYYDYELKCYELGTSPINIKNYKKQI